MTTRHPKFMHISPLRDAIFEHSRSYSSWGSDYSITSLIQPPQVVQLQKRYAQELDKIPMTDEFIKQQLGSFRGNAIHDRFKSMLYRFINKNPNSGYMIERRMWDRINDRKISGQFDALRNGALYDFKTTSVWKRVFGQLTDYEKQLNLYAYLLRTCGQEVAVLYVIAWYMDWDKWKANQEKYPSEPIEQILIENLWAPDQQKEYIHHRIDVHKADEDKPDNELTPCSDDDMWAKGSSYAVTFPNAKRAVATKGLDTRKKAEDYIKKSKHKNKDTWFVETRPGERTRCQDWCRYNGFCNQYQCYLKDQAEENSETPKSI